MEDYISKVAVVGSSWEGGEVAQEIFGKINLGKKSVVILIPHICAKSIYDHLSDKGKKVYPILDNQTIEPQSIYVGMENPTNLSDSDNKNLSDSDNFLGIERLYRQSQSIYVRMKKMKNPTDLSNSNNFSGIGKRLKIKKQEGKYKFFLGEIKIDYIDKAFFAVANAFKDKSIGIILYGMGGSGIEGTIKIKKVGGTTLVQEVDEKKYRYCQASMPYNVIQKGKADYILPPDKLGIKLEEMLR